MNNESRRGMLTKLGMGAAAVMTVAAATGNANAAPNPKLPPSKKPGKLPQSLRSSVRVNMNKLPSRNLQVRVAVTSVGVVLDAAQIDSPVSGLTSDNRVLQLGVLIDGKGGIEVQGLNSLLDRMGQVAAEGRCWANLSKGEEVSNPNPTLEGLTPKQMAQF